MSKKLISSGSPFEEKIGYSRAVVQDNWVLYLEKRDTTM